MIQQTQDAPDRESNAEDDFDLICLCDSLDPLLLPVVVLTQILSEVFHLHDVAALSNLSLSTDKAADLPCSYFESIVLKVIGEGN